MGTTIVRVPAALPLLPRRQDGKKYYPRRVTERMRRLAELVDSVRKERPDLRGAALFAYLKAMPECAGLLPPKLVTLRRTLADVRATARGVKLRAAAPPEKPSAAMRGTHA